MTALPVVRCIACAALGLVVLAAATRAQETRVLAPAPNATPADSVHLTLWHFDASERAGGHGWLRLAIDNRHQESVAVALRLTSPESRHVDLRRQVSVPARSRHTVEMVYPRVGLPFSLAAVLGNGATARFQGGIGIGRGDVGALLVGAAAGVWADAAGRAFDRGGAGPATGRPSTDPHEITPNQLPDDAVALTGYDLVVADADHPLLDRTAWATLLQYARLGGRLVVDRAHTGADPGLDALQARSTATSAGPRRVQSGFGVVLLRGRERPAHLDDATVAALHPLLFGPGPWSLESMLRSGTAGPLPQRHYRPQPLPGVASIPADAFLAIVLVFVILVGPVNHVFLRRRGQPWLVLFTVPIAGALVTAVILIGTAVVEGTGLRGVHDTLTVLDQPQRRATVQVRSTLFATVSPAQLTPRPGTWLSTSQMLQQSTGVGQVERTFRWATADDDDRALSGALLPSRQPTVVVSISDDVARDRLRFRLHDDGRVELLEGTQLRPRRGARAAVLRLPDGDWFVMSEDGVLYERSAAQAAIAVRGLLDTVRPPLRPVDSVWTGTGMARPVPGPTLPDRLGELPPGSYVCALEGPPPFADPLGLDVAWSGDGEHLLVGRIDAEDLSR